MINGLQLECLVMLCTKQCNYLFTSVFCILRLELELKQDNKLSLFFNLDEIYINIALFFTLYEL